MADGYVLRLLKNKRAELVALTQGSALDGIDDAPQAVFVATEDLDRAIGILESVRSETKTRAPSEAPKRTRKPRTRAPVLDQLNEARVNGPNLDGLAELGGDVP